MPLDERDYVRGKHPPSCTCEDCCESRLKQLKKEVHPEYVSYCPKCGQKSLWHKVKEQKYECLNLKCKYVTSSPNSIKTQYSGNETSKNNRPRTVISPISNWLKALLLIFTFSFLGLIFSTLIGSSIPFWILFEFSIIFSIEKWFSYYTRKHKWIGKLYRLILNLSILSLLGLLIWSGIRLFSGRFTYSALVGSLIFLAEFIFFIWMWSVISKNSWRWPSMKLTVFSLICLSVVFAFAGVQPMASYKNEAIGKVTAFFNEQKENAATKSEQVVITDTNTETGGGNFISKAIDSVGDIWDTRVADYASKFNQYRQSKELTALEFTDDLNRIADLRLKELYTNYSHNSAGNYNEHLAENIVMSTGFLSNSDALASWQNSPGHNANMLDSSYRYTGYAIGNGYAVQVFTEYPTIDGEPQLPPGWYWGN